MWKNILKTDDDEYEYGRRYRKTGRKAPSKNQPERREEYGRGENEGDPNTEIFREGIGFRDEDYSKFKGSGTEEMPSTDLANWFATVNDNFEELFNQLSGGIEGEGVGADDGSPSGGMPFKYKEDTGAFKQFKKSSMQFAKELTEKMLEQFLDSIFDLGEDTGLSSEELSEIIDEGSVYNLMNSKAYQEVTQAGLKSSTEIISAILDQAFVTIRKTGDRDSYKEDLGMEEMSPEELAKPLDLNSSKDIWGKVFTKTRGLVDSLVENITDDMFSDTKIDLNLEQEGGQVEMSAVKDAIASAAKNFVKDNDEISLIGANALHHFKIIYLPRLERLEESQTGEFEEEMADAPRIEFEDADEFDDDFREEFKSLDEVENSWQSILKVGGQAAVGMTSNAGFTPAVHNITYGDCGCEKKKSKCGCDD